MKKAKKIKENYDDDGGDVLARNGRRVAYSMREQEMFSFLGKKPKTTEQIANHFYGKSERPFHHRRIVSGALNSLALKVRMNREEFRLEKTPRAGRHSISYWIERLHKEKLS